MPTDKERREVARRLRETGDELEIAALLWYHIAKALGVRTATDGKTACGMLADLIEPRCDRDALLSLAKSLEGLSVCPHDPDNGTACVSVEFCENIARRIREALEVSDG